MDKGSAHKLTYEIYAPAEFDNLYEEKLNDFTWNFKVKEVEDGPQTGDNENLLFWMTISICSLLLLIKIKRNGDYDEK